MAIKTFKPYTPARRNMTVSGFDGVDKKAKPERSLVETLKKHAGRNSYGHITVRHHGGGNKRKYRIIDFKRLKTDMPATVERIEYDPNRSAYIALVKYEDGTLSYILAPYGLKAGDQPRNADPAFQAGDQSWITQFCFPTNKNDIIRFDISVDKSGSMDKFQVTQKFFNDSDRFFK